MNSREESAMLWRRATMILCGAVLLVLFAVGGSAEGDLLPHPPIEIIGNTGFTVENGVVGGSGTNEDPYLIEGWSIDAADSTFGVHVEGTTRAFVIERCRVFGASSTAIDLVDVKKASISGCEMGTSYFGLSAKNSDNLTIADNSFFDNDYAALFLINSSNNDIHDNLFHSGGPGILFYEKAMNNTVHDNVFDHCKIGISILSFAGGGSRIYYNDFLSCRAASEACNMWDDGRGTGNYWSEYGYKDADGDEIGDTPYRIFGSGYEYDYHPVINAFHPKTDE